MTIILVMDIRLFFFWLTSREYNWSVWEDSRLGSLWNVSQEYDWLGQKWGLRVVSGWCLETNDPVHHMMASRYRKVYRIADHCWSIHQSAFVRTSCWINCKRLETQWHSWIKHHRDYWYVMSREICIWFCCALLSCDYLCNGSCDVYYPYYSELIHWTWGNHTLLATG